MGYSLIQITEILCRNKSTISIKLNRNCDMDGYFPNRDENKYQSRRQKCRQKKLLEDPKLYTYVKDKFLNEQWPPEEIDERTATANDRSRLGYWEDDTVVGITGKACLGA